MMTEDKIRSELERILTSIKNGDIPKDGFSIGTANAHRLILEIDDTTWIQMLKEKNAL